MRIAVSGTHATGKTTLIEAFVSRHPQFAFEPEPYVLQQELYGEPFADFERQLELQIETLARYKPGDDVIFERSPADFLAYNREIDIGKVRAAIAQFDAIVFLPLDPRIEVGDDENPELRIEVDERLRAILFDDEFDLFDGAQLQIVEASGSVEDRLETLEQLAR